MWNNLERREFRSPRDQDEFCRQARKEFWARKQAEADRIEKKYGYV